MQLVLEFSFNIKELESIRLLAVFFFIYFAIEIPQCQFKISPKNFVSLYEIQNKYDAKKKKLTVVEMKL